MDVVAPPTAPTSPQEAQPAVCEPAEQASELQRPTLPDHPSSPSYDSPLRHRRRDLSRHRQVKESLNARSEYVTSEDDGVAEHRINQYIIKQEIGRGSFGAVHLAVDQYGTEFAVKEFSKARLRKRAQSHILRKPMKQRRRGSLKGLNSPLHRQESQADATSAVELIKEEIAIMKKLHHPNLVSLIEVLDDPTEDSLYMVMEMCKKGVVMRVGLEERADPYPEDTCRYWFRDLILGIEYLHTQGVVHRDIKPDNCLVTQDDVLKVVDFGVSEMFEKDSEMLTAKSVGSPAFLPPELCVAKHGDVSGKAADIWSMGVTLYCLKYGRIPFEKSGIFELYESIKTEQPEFPNETNPDFIDLMRRILEKDPAKRIKMPELRMHTWVTKGRKDPLLSEAENTADLVDPPTEAEMNAAITANINNLMTVIRAVNKFKALTAHKRQPVMKSILGEQSQARFTQPPTPIRRKPVPVPAAALSLAMNPKSLSAPSLITEASPTASVEALSTLTIEAPSTEAPPAIITEELPAIITEIPTPPITEVPPALPTNTPPVTTPEARPTVTSEARPIVTSEARPPVTSEVLPTVTSEAPPTATSEVLPTVTSEAPPALTTEAPHPPTTGAPSTSITEAPSTPIAEASSTPITEVPEAAPVTEQAQKHLSALTISTGERISSESDRRAPTLEVPPTDSKSLTDTPKLTSEASSDSEDILSQLSASDGADPVDLSRLPPFRPRQHWALTSDEVGRRGHARDPLENQLFLYIGPSTFAGPSVEYDRRSSFVPDDDDVPIVSESPGAADMDIYETAYRDEIERILARAREEKREPNVYLTRRVDEKLLAMSGRAGGRAGRFMAGAEEVASNIDYYTQFSARKAKVTEVSRALRQAAREEYEKHRQEKRLAFAQGREQKLKLSAAASAAVTDSHSSPTEEYRPGTEMVQSPTIISSSSYGPGHLSLTGQLSNIGHLSSSGHLSGSGHWSGSSHWSGSTWKGRAADKGRHARNSLRGFVDHMKAKSRTRREDPS
ncbi:hypothetical protein DV736_g2106, partial [Chaetothyriales sp. CBS 134916]